MLVIHIFTVSIILFDYESFLNQQLRSKHNTMSNYAKGIIKAETVKTASYLIVKVHTR